MRNRFGYTDDLRGVPRNKTFGGRVYQLAGVDKDRDGARDEADAIRSSGSLARFVRVPGGRWAIYTREP